MGDVTLKKHVAKKQFIFESWVDTAFDFARARGFRELKLKHQAFSNLKYAISYQ